MTHAGIFDWNRTRRSNRCRWERPLRRGVLQNKPGELDVLRHTATDIWLKFTPLIQIVGPKLPAEAIKAGNYGLDGQDFFSG